MSEEELTHSEDDSDAAGYDASMKVDSSSLTSDEADFARQMGFGDDDDSEAPEPPSRAPAASVDATAAAEDAAPPVEEEEAPDEAEAAEVEDTPDEAEPVEAQADADDDEEEKQEEVEAPQNEPPVAAETNDDGDFEEIHPSASADSMQATLEARADDVLERVAQTAQSDAPKPSALTTSADTSALDAEIATLKSELEVATQNATALRAQIDDRDAELEMLRVAAAQDDGLQAKEAKEIEALQSEIDAISLDRDQLIDQLAVTSGKLVQSTGHCEKLEASLRAARGALTPLPEGERALRAEVIGLRGRLEEAGEEYQALAAQLAESATELAIARARVEDRQHEVNAHVERVEELNERLEESERELAAGIARHREILATSTRLQADNNELRSAQAALEETLQARDLEILAREEHLAVTRQGLAARDTQLVDVQERLDQAKRVCEAQQADLQRAEIERDQLIEKVAQRESRIATLTETLARIEEAMGHPLPKVDSPAREMPEAEWSKPVRAEHTAAARVTEANRAVEPVAPSVPEPSLPETTEATIVDVDVDVDVEPEIQSVSSDDSEEGVDVTETCPSDLILAPPPRLPAILSHWRNKRFGEIMGENEAPSVHAFLAERLHRHLGSTSPQNLYLRSLGGSLPDAEVHLVQALQALGIGGLRLDVLDVDPEQAEVRRQRIELAGLGEVIEVTVGDLDQWDGDAPCHGILVSDALNAQPNVGAFLEHIATAITNGAVLLFLDRIATGPLQLSASALNRLKELWEVLPESLASADGLSIVPHRGDDGGFQPAPTDAAGLLMNLLEPSVVAGFGHLADLVVGPTRGGALSIDDEESRQLLESIMTIDESRSVTEQLAPRHGLAVFAHTSTGDVEVIGQAWPDAQDTDR